MLHKNVISRYTGADTYGCGAPVEDRGDITDKEAMSLPRCPQCFKEEGGVGMVDASAKGGGEGEASAKKRSSSARPAKEGWL